MQGVPSASSRHGANYRAPLAVACSPTCQGRAVNPNNASLPASAATVTRNAIALPKQVPTAYPVRRRVIPVFAFAV